MLKNLYIRTYIASCLILAFLLYSFGPISWAQAQDFYLPAPGVMVQLSLEFNPPLLKGIRVHPNNPFQFDFILEQGDSELGKDQIKDESSKLIKYFLASLTIPEKDLWVNLSPYEKDRIIPNSFGLTEMGRDLLAEDYMLKQITASLIYPEDEIGKKFWKRIYEEAAKKFGTTNIPVNTFNKVWIVPEKAVVYENAKIGAAYVVESKLKIMLEQDYLSLVKHEGIQSLATVINKSDINNLGSQVVREIVIPELTREVNKDKNFAQLRQVYNSLILATWYKKKIKDSILERFYADKNKVVGVNIDDPKETQRIYQRYLEAFKKGAFNYIKASETPYGVSDATIGQSVPRKYFSGGITDVDLVTSIVIKPFDAAMHIQDNNANEKIITIDMVPVGMRVNGHLGKIETNSAMLSKVKEEKVKEFLDFLYYQKNESSGTEEREAAKFVKNEEVWTGGQDSEAVRIIEQFINEELKDVDQNALFNMMEAIMHLRFFTAQTLPRLRVFFKVLCTVRPLAMWMVLKLIGDHTLSAWIWNEGYDHLTGWKGAYVYSHVIVDRVFFDNVVQLMDANFHQENSDFSKELLQLYQNPETQAIARQVVFFMAIIDPHMAAKYFKPSVFGEFWKDFEEKLGDSDQVRDFIGEYKEGPYLKYEVEKSRIRRESYILEVLMWIKSHAIFKKKEDLAKLNHLIKSTKASLGDTKLLRYTSRFQERPEIQQAIKHIQDFQEHMQNSVRGFTRQYFNTLDNLIAYWHRSPRFTTRRIDNIYQITENDLGKIVILHLPNGVPPYVFLVTSYFSPVLTGIDGVMELGRIGGNPPSDSEPWDAWDAYSDDVSNGLFKVGYKPVGYNNASYFDYNGSGYFEIIDDQTPDEPFIIENEEFHYAQALDAVKATDDISPKARSFVNFNSSGFPPGIYFNTQIIKQLHGGDLSKLDDILSDINSYFRGLEVFRRNDFQTVIDPRILVNNLRKKININIPGKDVYLPDEAYLDILNRLLKRQDLYKFIEKLPEDAESLRFISKLKKGEKLNLFEITRLNRRLLMFNFPELVPKSYMVSDFRVSVRSGPYISMPGKLTTVMDIDLKNENALREAFLKVIASWDNPLAVAYRKQAGIDQGFRMDILVQTIPYDKGATLKSYGNKSVLIGSGVAFSRDPQSAERKTVGVFAEHKTGEEVVSGSVSGNDLEALREQFPGPYEELNKLVQAEEAIRKYPVEVEYNVVQSTSYLSWPDLKIIQVKKQMLPPLGELKYIISLINSGEVSMPQVIDRLKVLQQLVGQRMLYTVRPDFQGSKIAQGIASAGGAMAGRVIFHPERITNLETEGPVIIICTNTNKNQVIETLNRFPQVGVITTFGNMGEHNVQVTAAAGIPIVINIAGYQEKNGELVGSQGETIKEGDFVVVDADKNAVYKTTPTDLTNVLIEDKLIQDHTFGIDIKKYMQRFIAPYVDEKGDLIPGISIDELCRLNEEKYREYVRKKKESDEQGAFLATIEKHALHDLLEGTVKRHGQKAIWDAVSASFVIQSQDALQIDQKEFRPILSKEIDEEGPDDALLETELTYEIFHMMMEKPVSFSESYESNLPEGDSKILGRLKGIVENIALHGDAFSVRVGILAQAIRVYVAKRFSNTLQDFSYRSRINGDNSNYVGPLEEIRIPLRKIFDQLFESYVKLLKEQNTGLLIEQDLIQRKALQSRLYIIGQYLKMKKQLIDIDVARATGNTLVEDGMPNILLKLNQGAETEIHFPVFSVREDREEPFDDSLIREWNVFLGELDARFGPNVSGHLEKVASDGHQFWAQYWFVPKLRIPKTILPEVVSYLKSSDFLKEKDLIVQQERFGLPVDEAMKTNTKKYRSNEGGIDLTTANKYLQERNNDDEIKFHIDPAMLQQLQNTSGFVPVIINIQPMTNLRRFFDIP